MHTDDWAANRQIDRHIHTVSIHQAVVHRPAPPRGSSHWSTYPGCRVLLEQIETKAFYDWATTVIPVIRPENAPRKREGGHVVLRGREDVASVQSREPSECHG